MDGFPHFAFINIISRTQTVTLRGFALELVLAVDREQP